MNWAVPTNWFRLLLVVTCVYERQGAMPGTAALGASAICMRLAGLSPSQRATCSRRPGAVAAGALGAAAAAAECARLFREQRWNCTSVGPSVGVMGTGMPIGSREAAFLHALRAAAVAHSVAAACGRGAARGCGCGSAAEGGAVGAGGAYGAVGGARAAVGGAQRTAPGAGAPRRQTAAGGAYGLAGGAYGLAGGANGLEGRVYGLEGGANAKWGGVNGLAGGANGLEGGANAKGGGVWEEQGAWRWGGCSASVDHGAEFSREFVDSGETTTTGGAGARALMDLHNHGAGREALRRVSALHCRCHGISGSCSTRTCWAVLPPLREVALRLKVKFDTAHEVEPVLATRHRRPVFLRLKRPDRSGATSSGSKEAKSWQPRKPIKEDLVFLEKSPNFCEENARAGVAGTRGRWCQRRPGAGGCELLCCGRGYNTVLLHHHRHEEDDGDEADGAATGDGDDGHGGARGAGGAGAGRGRCNCTFHWCCHVSCSACAPHRHHRRRLAEGYTCK